MCLLLLSFNQHPVYPLIVAANRDEFYNRPTTSANFWENTSLLAGRDLKAGGTWLGITRDGKFAAITNFRDKDNYRENATSRGGLVVDFLLGDLSSEDFGKLLLQKSSEYNGFNLIFGMYNSLNYFNNISMELKLLESGVYGLSNHLLDIPWPKVTKGKDEFRKILRNSNFTPSDILEILLIESELPDKTKRTTNPGIEVDEMISPIFITTEAYGTRSSTVILVDKSNHVSFTEKSLNTLTKNWETSSFTFNLK